MNNFDLKWFWKSFDQLSKHELYEVLKFRQLIFVVEQKSWYLDADGLDQCSEHLLVKKDENLVGYLRLTPPKKKYKVPSLGRIAVQENMRGNNFGYEIVSEGLKKSNELYNSVYARISAQQYLINFYERLGFEVEGDIYDEDGIPHIQMVKNG